MHTVLRTGPTGVFDARGRPLDRLPVGLNETLLIPFPRGVAVVPIRGTEPSGKPLWRSRTLLTPPKAKPKPKAKKTRGLLDGVLGHLSAAAERVGLTASDRAKLARPERVLSFDVPVTMDDGTERTFDAWRILHSTARGPGKGGIRVATGVDERQVGGLAAEMPAKPSIHHLPLGGAKGGIDADANAMSSRELAVLMRGYVTGAMDTAWAEDHTFALGPKTDIPAPDVGTSPPDINLMDVCADSLLGWLVERGVDELDGYAVPDALRAIPPASDEKATPYLDAYVDLFERGEIADLGLISTFTGKSVGKGGSEGRTEATGLGVAFAALELLARRGELPAGAERFAGQTVAVQGFGNVGLGSVASFARLGAKVVSIAEFDGESYALVKPGGFDEADVEALTAYKKTHGTLRGFPGANVVEMDTFWRLPVDILAPCARENEITPAIAERIHAKVVVEGANGPTTTRADAVLARRGIDLAPDIFANAAGVTVSYFEMIQNQRGERWSLDEARSALREMVHTAFGAIVDEQARRGGTLRDAAFDVAVTGMFDEPAYQP